MNAIKLGAIFALMSGMVTIACQNSGEGHVLGIEATGTVAGVVFFDRNGNRVSDAGDTIVSNLPIRLVTSGTRDTAARVNSSTTGGFLLTAVPVGTYRVVVDSALPGDSIRVIRIDTNTVTIRQLDTVTVRIAVGYPQVSIAEFRALAPGKKAFVAGVVLNPRGIFSDTTVNMANPTTAIRLTNVRTPIVGTGDSIRALGVRAVRDGQPVLDQGVAFPLSTFATLPIQQVSSGTAANAQSGAIDAAFVRILNARIMDTATVDRFRRLHVDDNSGPVEVTLDTLLGFRGTALAPDTVGARFDVYGLLVPTGPGTWRVQPRFTSDMVKR